VTTIEERFRGLMARASYEAWLRLQELRDYPHLNDLIDELELLSGTLLDIQVEAAYERSLNRRVGPQDLHQAGNQSKHNKTE